MSRNFPVPGGYREVLRVAWPLIISNGSFTLMTFVDRVFLSWYSPTSIQAALPAGILSFSLICWFMAVAGYSNTFVAQYHGAKDPRGCSRATAQGLWLALLSWPLILLLIPVGHALLRLSGHPPDVLGQELSYFNLLMAGGVTIPLNAAITSFFTGRGETKINMMAQIAGNVTNAVLDWFLIFGHAGLPALGIRGAAIATIIAGCVAPAILLVLYFSRRMHAVYATRDTLAFDATLMRRLIRFGVPSGFHLILDVSGFTAFVLLTGRLGPTALAVSNIGFSINMVAFMPLLGISIAAMTLVGQYLGARDPLTAEGVGWRALHLGLLYMCIAATTFVSFPAAYFSLFAQNKGGIPLPEMLGLGRVMLRIMAVWGVFDAVNLILSGALKGAGDTRFVMWYSSLQTWCVLVPGQWYITCVMHGTILHAWGWLAFHVVLMSTGFLWRYRSGRWKSIDVIEREPPLQATRPGGEVISVQ